MYDIAIIGGGINGVGIARDAAGRGHSVYLAEKGDLASGTSSWSTKLIHGGLRYLEHYEFRLVREALVEREVLWGMAPHIVWPLRFVLPHHKGLRPAWLIRFGLFLYDHLGGRKRLPATRVRDLANGKLAGVLRDEFQRGFEYSDCWVDDARLVVLNARDAADRGAVIQTRTKVETVFREDDHWIVEVRDLTTGNVNKVEARIVVNASGPWADEVLAGNFGANNARNIRLVKGSHIIVPRIGDHDESFIFQNADGRIIFVIPYEVDFSLIGTTDEDHAGNPDNVQITDDEINYLCAAVTEYFTHAVTPEDVVWTFSGVRSLFNDGVSKAQEVTRDYVLATEGEGREARLINVFGGKITTYRRLAESVLDKIEATLGDPRSRWTMGAKLPGGDFDVDDTSRLKENLCHNHPYLHAHVAERFVRTYGTVAEEILTGVTSWSELGEDFGSGLTEREVAHLVENEWAMTAEDVLWRRTKIGLRLTAEERAALEHWFGRNGVYQGSSVVFDTPRDLS